MAPPSKRRKIEEQVTDKVPISSVLKWFDTSNRPSIILCREEEKQKIDRFVQSCLNTEKGGSLYICGSPGIGKSLLITQILDDFKCNDKRIKTVYINATTSGTNQNAYSAICELILNKKETKDKAKQIVEDNLIHSSRKRILCIDEVDQLLTNERSAIYDIFEWPYIARNVIIVIGIANSVDMVEKLEIEYDIWSNNGIDKKPETLVFPSYSSDDLKLIVQQRIDLCNESLHSSFSLFHPLAIQLCSKKVAEMGDARRLLDICRAALQTTYDDGIVTSENEVTVPVMSKTLFQVFRTSQPSRIAELPRLAQVLLASLCAMVVEMKGKNNVITMKKLKEVYFMVLKTYISGNRPNLSDFPVLFDQLIHNGMCKVSEGKRIKSEDRPIVMLSSTDDIITELNKQSELAKILKKGGEFMK